MPTLSVTIFPMQRSQPLVAGFAMDYARKVQDQIPVNSTADRFLRERQMTENAAELAAATVLAACAEFPTYRYGSEALLRSFTRTVARFCLDTQIALLVADETKPVRASRIRQIATFGRQAYLNYTSSARLRVAALG